jgi:hypothetical protein
MLMVIFGAGASWDSYAGLLPPNVNNLRLPLADGLFDRRFGEDYQLFPKCKPLIQRLQRPSVNVEKTLEKFQSEESRYPARRTQLASVRYYLNRMLARCQSAWLDFTKGVTNYQTMLDQIEAQRIQGEKICLVTFNYDTLLEEAIKDSIGVTLNTIPQYVASDYKVIKPHGSINWAHPIKNFQSHRSNSQDLISDILSNMPSLDIDSESYETVSEDPLSRPPLKPFFPALAIPVENKQRYECPSEHWNVLEQCLPKVTNLLIIGWRANEGLFLDTLGKGIAKNARVMVVSGTEIGTDEIIARMMARWRETGVNTKFIAAKPGFSSFIFGPEWEYFLKTEP